MNTVKLAVMASGSGSNAENLINYFNDSKEIEVSLILTNRKNAFVIDRAKRLNVPFEIFNRAQLEDNDAAYITLLLRNHHIDYLILAGFLMKIPEALIRNFPEKIINIHPSLLPAYGGKGMYGSHVHEAVIAAGERQSGITIHLVNEEYDKGKILFQATCEIDSEDTAGDLAKKIHQLEYSHFPKVVENYIRSRS